MPELPPYTGPLQRTGDCPDCHGHLIYPVVIIDLDGVTATDRECWRCLARLQQVDPVPPDLTGRLSDRTLAELRRDTHGVQAADDVVQSAGEWAPILAASLLVIVMLLAVFLR